jgi:hypothetical protein
VTSGHSSAGEPTRERVRATIGLVGGYWRPLAAVARMQEELGELAELPALSLAPPDTDATRKPQAAAIEPQAAIDPGDERYAAELADLWIITTALADQFHGAVAEPDSHTGHRPDRGVDRVSRGGQAVSGDLLGGLVAAAGRIARIVNYYDGPKTPRAFEGWVSLGDAVADFHRTIAEAAHAHGVDLATAVSRKLDAIPALDSGRFRAGEHDPSTAASLESFRAIPAAAPDSDSGLARLWGSPGWSSEPFTSNLDPIVADLTSFTKAAPWERLDGYVICGPPLTSTALLEGWFTHLLAEITARDPAGERSVTGPVDDGPVDDGPVDGHLDPPARRLTFNGLHLLATVFSPLYDASDPRHSPAGARRSPGGTRQSPAGTFALLRVEHATEGRTAQ